MSDSEERIGVHADRLIIAGFYRDKLLLQKEARERYLNERPKLYRMLRALWRVKDA